MEEKHTKQDHTSPLTTDYTHSESEIKDQETVHTTICERTAELSTHQSHDEECKLQDLTSLDVRAETAIISTSDAKKSCCEIDTRLCITASSNYSPSLQENDCNENTESHEQEILDTVSTMYDPRLHVENSDRLDGSEVERLKIMTDDGCSS